MDPATPLLALSKAISYRSRAFPASSPHHILVRRRLPPATLGRAPVAASAHRRLAVPGDLLLLSLARLALRGPASPRAGPPRRWFASVSAASSLSSTGPPGGGGGRGSGDGGGRGDGGGGGWNRPRASQGTAVAEEAAGQKADTIILDVGV